MDFIIKYLEKEWSEDSIHKFLDKLSHSISLIQLMPRAGEPYLDYKNTRSIGVVKQIRLYYTIVNDTIFINSLFDNRQNPQKKKF